VVVGAGWHGGNRRAMTTADTLRLRDRLLTGLRVSRRPLSTTELATRMPWRVERSEDTCALLGHRINPNQDVEVLDCQGSWHIVHYRRTAHGYTGIYRYLRSLEQQGLVRRTLQNGRKRVCWVYVDSDQLATAPKSGPRPARDAIATCTDNGRTLPLSQSSN